MRPQGRTVGIAILGIVKSVDLVPASLWVSVPQYIVHERAFSAESLGRRSLQCNACMLCR